MTLLGWRLENGGKPRQWTRLVGWIDQVEDIVNKGRHVLRGMFGIVIVPKAIGRPVSCVAIAEADTERACIGGIG